MQARATVRPSRNAVADAFGAIGVIFIALMLLTGFAARAQETPAEEAPAEETEADEPPFSETITVTANKREENVREVASSISVIDEDQLENLDASQLTDFAAYVPGLQVTSVGTPGQTTLSLRGIAPISSGATVATYVGEAPLGSSGLYQRATAFALDLLPYDIERVEVLRGPQGTLYGAGAMGGILKYVTRDPDPSSREVRLGGGLSDAGSGSGVGGDVFFNANLPLAADRAALRVSYARNEIAGYVDNGLDDRHDINDGSQESARIALWWRAGDAVRLKLDVMRQSIDTDNNAVVALDPATLQPLTGDLESELFVDEPFTKEIDFYLATLDFDLGWAQLTSASGYSDVSTDQRLDATFLVGEFPLLMGLAPGISFFDLGLELEKFTQELRLTSRSAGRFEWQFGAFYTDERAANSQIVRLFDMAGAPITGLDPLTVTALPSDYQETAAFGNVTFEVTDRFKMDLGARFSRNEQDFAQVVTEGILLPIDSTPGSSEEEVFTWSVGPRLQLTDDAMLYAKIATGYQPGGPNVALPGVPPSVDASRLTSYEVGLKSELHQRRWLLDLAAYSIDWRDIQITASVEGVSFLVNGGEAVSRGLELATAFKPTDRLRIGFNGAYSDATVANDVPSLGGRDGDRLSYIPELSWSATADYYFQLGGAWNGHAGGGYRWVGDRMSSLESDPASFPLESYGALDLHVELFNGEWTIRAFLRNATDERAYLTMNPVTSVLTGVTRHVRAAPIQPRTLGIQLGFTF